MSVSSFVLLEVSTILQSVSCTSDFLVSKWCQEAVFFNVHFDCFVEIFDESFTSHKYYFGSTIVSISIKYITYSSLNLIQSQELAISIVVRFTTNLKHTRSMRNWFSIISILKINSTVFLTIVFSNPQTLFVHNSHHKIELTHFLVNPKIRSSARRIFELILSYNISKITSNFFRVSMELKLRSHRTSCLSIASISLRIRFGNCRCGHTPILTFF